MIHHVQNIWYRKKNNLDIVLIKVIRLRQTTNQPPLIERSCSINLSTFWKLLIKYPILSYFQGYPHLTIHFFDSDSKPSIITLFAYCKSRNSNINIAHGYVKIFLICCCLLSICQKGRKRDSIPHCTLQS